MFRRKCPHGSKVLARRRSVGQGLECLEGRLLLHHDALHTLQSHAHSYLTVYINGSRQTIPADVGVGPGLIAPIHTHDTLGKLHVEPDESTYAIPGSPRFPTVGDFFNNVWRLHAGNGGIHPNAIFSSTNILGNQNSATHQVRFYVNGAVNTEFENYILRDGDDLVISYETIAPGGNIENPTFVPIPDTRVKTGSPLLVPLDGFDAQGGPLTYSVQVTPLFGNPQLTGRILANQRYARIRVRDFGDMVFQLFDDMAPRVADHIAAVAASDNPERPGTQPYYNDVLFHRVIDGFVIQAGDSGPSPGEGGSSLGLFDDQFHVDLQFNRRGLLAMAKTSDDTNDAQFFITDTPISGLDNGSHDGYPRHLDFNHSIFGVLVEGQDVLERISDVAVSNSAPNTPVVIESFEIVSGGDNGVLLLKAPEGAIGGAEISVTVEDPQGHSFTRRSRVTVAPDTVNATPFLEDIAARRITVGGGPVQISAVAYDVENNPISFQVAPVTIPNATASWASTQVTPTALNVDNELTITPNAEFIGTINFSVFVHGFPPLNPTVAGEAATLNAAASGQFDVQVDRQAIRLTIAPLAPAAVDLQSAADSGISDTDNITSALRPSFDVTGVASGAIVQLYDGSQRIAQAIATGNSASPAILFNFAAGEHVITATQTINGVESDRSQPLEFTIDRTAPPAITPALPDRARIGRPYLYDADNSEERTLGFRYSLPVAPVGASIDPFTGIILWAPTLDDVGLKTLAVVAADAAGNGSIILAQVVVHTGELRPGDANLDGVVDRADLASLAQNLGRTDSGTWIEGDFNGDRRVNLRDLLLLQAHFNAGVASSSSAAAAVDRALEETHDDRPVDSGSSSLRTAVRHGRVRSPLPPRHDEALVDTRDRVKVVLATASRRRLRHLPGPVDRRA